MGDADGIGAILRDVVRPRAAYLAARAESLPAVAQHYRIEPGPPMVRMWVDRHAVPAVARPRSSGSLPGRDRRAQPAVRPRVRGAGCPRARSPRASTTAIRVNGRLVAAAGTHVISRARRGSPPSATC